MSLPTRPVAHAAIETAWGQEIHDRVLAASGCDVWSSTTSSLGAGATQLNLDMVHTDPGGFLDAAHDQIVIPTGKGGLYLIVLWCQSVNGSNGAGFGTRCGVYINGTPSGNGLEDNEGTTVVNVLFTTLRHLAAGDILQAWGLKKGSGTNPTVNVMRFQIVRLTDDYGA